MATRRSLLTSASALAALSFVQPAWADDPIPVVASFSILGDMVERIGGEHVSVTTLVGPGGDAHVFQPTPRDAQSVAGADVLFTNGLEFEGWMDRLVEAAGFGGTLVVTTQGIEAIAYEDDHDDHADHDDHDDHADHDDHDDHAEDKDHDHDDHADGDDHDHDHDEDKDHDDHDHAEHKDEDHDDHDHAEHEDHDEHDHDEDHAEHKDHDHGEEHAEHDDHDDHHGHDHGAFDPHAWQSLGNAVIYADNIAAALSKADPNNASDYFANRAAFVGEIEALSAEVAQLMASIPEDKRTIVTSHDAFQYFGRDYGLTFVAPQGLSTESEASAGDVAELIEQIREDGISAVFVESITDDRLIKQIANETGATFGGTLYPGALSLDDGPAATYLDMIRHNATTIADTLGS